MLLKASLYQAFGIVWTIPGCLKYSLTRCWDKRRFSCFTKEFHQYEHVNSYTYKCTFYPANNRIDHWNMMLRIDFGCEFLSLELTECRRLDVNLYWCCLRNDEYSAPSDIYFHMYNTSATISLLWDIAQIHFQLDLKKFRSVVEYFIGKCWHF